MANKTSKSPYPSAPKSLRNNVATRMQKVTKSPISYVNTEYYQKKRGESSGKDPDILATMTKIAKKKKNKRSEQAQ